MFLEIINERLWTLLFLPLFLLCGSSLLLRCRFLPLRGFRKMLRIVLRGEEEGESGLRPAQAAGTALAATVGTGNIVGTAQAIAMGGPGALFWLWAAAILGMTIKYAEILHGQRAGGAMGYISSVLGKLPARLYAFFAVLSALTVGNMAQMNGAANALCALLKSNSVGIHLLVGAALTAALAGFLCGGIKRVGQLSGQLVPFMTLSYLFLTGTVILHCRTRLLPVLQGVLRAAFQPEAAMGAASGVALRQTVLWGLRRGAFSNEAGLGTAANIHAYVPAKQPEQHALWGIFEVFVDTIVLCSATALAILCSGVEIPYGALPGSELLEQALACVLGRRAARIYVSCALLLFGFTTVLGCWVHGERCASWLGGERGVGGYRILYLLCALLGSVLPLGLIWQAADVANVFLACPNLLALLILAPETGQKARESLFRRRVQRKMRGSNA